MKHPTPRELSAFLDRAPESRERESLARHLEHCPACRKALAELAAQDRSLASALSHDPGEAYFESFAGRVEDRLRARLPGGVGARAGAPAGGLRGWLSSPRGLAWAGGVAALVVGLGLVLVTARESRIPELRKPEVVRRSEQVAEPTRPFARPAPEGQPAAPESRPAPAPASESASPPGVMTHGAPSPGRARSVAPQAGAITPGAPSRGGAERATPAPGPVPSMALPPSEPTADRAAEVPTSVEASRSAASRVEEREKGGTRAAAGTKRATPAEPGPAAQSRPPTLAPGDKRQGAAPTLLDESARPAAPEAFRKTDSVRSRLQARERRDAHLEGAAGRGRICGTVRDPMARPIAGAQVMIADLGLATTTDREGRFCIGTPGGERSLSVMAVGFETVRRTVRVGLEAAEENVILKPVAVLELPGALERAQGATQPGKLAVKAGPDIFSVWPPEARELARQAQRRSDAAARLGSAASFDRAAADWERALQKTKGTETELETRSRIADARYRAWRIAATPRRAQAAAAALEAYVARAPAGAARELAERRLREIGR